MAEMIDTQPLFPGESEIDQLYLIQKVLGPLTLPQQETFQKNPRFLGLKFPEISRCETLEKRYIKAERKAIDFLGKLLKMEPGGRMTASEALQHPYLADLSDRPVTTSAVSRADSANARGRYAGMPSNKNKRTSFASNPAADNKKHFLKGKEEPSLSPPPAAIKDTQYNIPAENIKSVKVSNNFVSKIRSSPFACDNDFKPEGKIDREKSREGFRHNENEGKVLRKKKSAIEDNQMFHIFEEEENKISPRFKPMSNKKKNTKVFYPQDTGYEMQVKNLRSGIFNRAAQKVTSEGQGEDEVSNHQSARQLPNIYASHNHAEVKRTGINERAGNERSDKGERGSKGKDEDPDLGGGPQYMTAFQPDEFAFVRSVKYNYEYKQRN